MNVTGCNSRESAVVVATVSSWSILPGRRAEFAKQLEFARERHEKYGGTVRVWNNVIAGDAVGVVRPVLVGGEVRLGFVDGIVQVPNLPVVKIEKTAEGIRLGSLLHLGFELLDVLFVIINVGNEEGVLATREILADKPG